MPRGAEREERSVLTDWWHALDRVALAAMVILGSLGLIIVLAATPAIALRRGLPPFSLFQRHVLTLALAGVVAILLSMVTPRIVRRISLLTMMLGLGGLVAVLAVGPEINGARRWLRFGGFSLQPSEFVKPAFVVLAGFLLSEAQRAHRHLMPVAVALFAATVLLIILEPDVGQAALLTAVWFGMLVLAGVSLKILAGVALIGIAGFASAATAFEHVNRRLMAFLFTGKEGQQALRARQSFIEGGLFGRGPGEGSIKNVLSDAHTDYVFAVVAEEYGALACLVLLFLVAMIALRWLDQALSADDPFVRIALGGLALLFAGQALIHMGVNVGLLPAKGMTMPLISAGGSSTVGMGLLFGFALALSHGLSVDPKRAK